VCPNERTTPMTRKQQATQPKAPTSIHGVTYLNLPETAWGGPTTPASLEVTDLDATDGEVQLMGTVQYDGMTYPVHISGTFHASELAAADRVATAKDLNGNFTVIQMAMRRNPPREIFVAEDPPQGPVFFLYLQRTDTREVTVIEAPVKELAAGNLHELLAAVKAKGHLTADYWPQKLFAPTSMGERTEDEASIQVVGQTTGQSLTAMSEFDDDEISMQAVGNTEYQMHWETYQVIPGCDITYWILIQALSNGPSDIGRSAADFNHKLTIVGKWTTSNCAFYASQTSPFIVGSPDGPVKVMAKVWGDSISAGDVFLSGKWDGSFTEQIWNQASVSFSVGLSVYFAAITAEIPLSATISESKSTTYVYPAEKPARWTKRVRHFYSGRYLVNVNDNFTFLTQVAWAVGPRGTKELRTKWVIPVYSETGVGGAHRLRATYRKSTRMFYISG
jgi:hypothetical protein